MIRAARAEEPSIAALHADWRRAWGRSIESPELRSALEESPRLRRRIVRMVAEAHELPMSGAPRFDEVSGPVAKALTDDRAGFLRLCGLAQIGRRLAMATNADDYRALARAFGAPALAAAVRISNGLPAGDEAHGYDSEQLVPAVDRLGVSVLREWIATQPGTVGLWMTMMLPRQRGEDGVPVGTARASAIVDAAARQWPLPRPAIGNEVSRQRRRVA